ncbi:MAG: MarR family winged helix-turn-helix transcriptional regulator [Candidatus Methanomethylophilaceae archaeon]
MELSKDLFTRFNNISRKSSRLIVELVNRRMGDRNLRRYHIAVISVIGSEPGISQKAVIDRTLYNKARVSIITAELIEMGYVVNSSSSKISSLALTRKGKEVFEECRELFVEHNMMMLKGVGEAEVCFLVEILSKIDNNLESMNTFEH